MHVNTIMKQLKLWMLAAILTCGATVFTSCTSDNDDNPVPEPGTSNELVGQWYADIRLASLQAATDLFGADAVEVTTVDEAWKAVGVVEGGEATAIRNTRLATDGLSATDNAVYDLSGRKVQNPQKGLYIKSGKKVLVSDKR